jgi:hypothetical protein
MWASENHHQGGGEKRGCPIGVFQVPVISKHFVTKLAHATMSIVMNMRKFQRNVLVSFSLPLETTPAMG